MRNSITGFLFENGSPLSPFNLLLACAVGACVAIAALSDKVSALFSGRLFVALLCAASSAANLALWVSDKSTALAVVGSALFALSYTALPLAWGKVLLKTLYDDAHGMLMVLFTSYLLSFVFGYLSYLPEPISLLRPIARLH